LVGLAGHDLRPQGGIGREYAMEANEMESGTRDEGSQTLEEFQRGHDEMGVMAWCLWIHFRDASIFVTSSGERAYTKKFSGHKCLKKSRGEWPYRIVFIKYFIVECTQVPNRKLLILDGFPINNVGNDIS